MGLSQENRRMSMYRKYGAHVKMLGWLLSIKGQQLLSVRLGWEATFGTPHTHRRFKENFTVQNLIWEMSLGSITHGRSRIFFWINGTNTSTWFEYVTPGSSTKRRSISQSDRAWRTATASAAVWSQVSFSAVLKDKISAYYMLWEGCIPAEGFLWKTREDRYHWEVITKFILTTFLWFMRKANVIMDTSNIPRTSNTLQLCWILSRMEVSKSEDAL